ncbi:hypothetical protein D3C76_1354360 [compost metagenome]
MQFGIALQCQAFSLLNDPLVELVALRRVGGGIDRCHDLARQSMPLRAHQVDRHRTVAQQMPIHRGEERALEHRLVLHLLDQQVGLPLGDVIQDVPLEVVGPCGFGRHRDPGVAQSLRLVMQPIVLVLQISGSRRGPIPLLEQGQNVQ